MPIRAVGTEGEISSTRIRALIAAGEVGEAARLLGRPYVVRGEVVVGDRRGRTIGFPTANVLPDPSVVVPARGVYAGSVTVGDERFTACTNVGVAPTFERGESRVEAYLLDFDGDLYGRDRGRVVLWAASGKRSGSPVSRSSRPRSGATSRRRGCSRGTLFDPALIPLDRRMHVIA